MRCLDTGADRGPLFDCHVPRYVHPSEDALMNVFSRLQMPKELPSFTL